MGVWLCEAGDVDRGGLFSLGLEGQLFSTNGEPLCNEYRLCESPSVIGGRGWLLPVPDKGKDAMSASRWCDGIRLF
jgi:hypothetical protein